MLIMVGMASFLIRLGTGAVVIKVNFDFWFVFIGIQF